MNIIDYEGNKYLIMHSMKCFDDKDLFIKIKDRYHADSILKKDDIFYFCNIINDAKYEDIIEVSNDIKNENKVSLDNTSL